MFELISQNFPHKIKNFKNVDHLIDEAYSYVKNTNSKLLEVRLNSYLKSGFRTLDYDYFLISDIATFHNKHELYDQILNLEIPLIDYINNQLEHLIFYA